LNPGCFLINLAACLSFFLIIEDFIIRHYSIIKIEFLSFQNHFNCSNLSKNPKYNKNDIIFGIISLSFECLFIYQMIPILRVKINYVFYMIP
jgi:hypothetical protein